MTKRVQIIRAGRIDQVPPWCFMQAGLSPEEGALAVAKDLKLTHPLDLLNVLLILRRAKEVEAKASEIERRLILAELKVLAFNAGLIDVDWIGIADLSGLRLNETGVIEGAIEFIEVMKRGKPHLFKKGYSA